MNSLVDVRDALPAVRVPTLVVHRRGDQVVRIEHGRYMADHIPGARFVELAGEDHFVSGGPDQILDAVDDFLTAAPEPPAPALSLAAIVAPSRTASDGLVDVLTASGGRVRRGADERAVVLFDGPATAARAALRALRHHGEAGLALHVAEVQRDAPRLEDHGVSLALRVSEVVPRGRVWATSTVRDLLAGSGIRLQPVGDGAADVVDGLSVYVPVAAE